MSYNGHSTKDLSPPSQCVTDAQIECPDVLTLWRLDYGVYGAAKVDIIAHSLGVVLARKMMTEPPDCQRANVL